MVSKPAPGPRIGRHLDQERASVGTVAIVVGAEYPDVGRAERQRQAVERPGAAVPDELVRAPVGRGAEPVRVVAADPRKCAVRADDQIGFAHLVQPRDLRIETKLYAEASDVVVEQGQELQSPDRREAVAAMGIASSLWTM